MRFVSMALVAACGTPASSVPPDANDLDAAGTPGFTAQYFDGYRVLADTRVESAIDHTWPAAPLDGVGDDRFSARFTGTLQISTAGTYTFAIDADDGTRLWVDNALAIDDWRG